MLHAGKLGTILGMHPSVAGSLRAERLGALSPKVDLVARALRSTGHQFVTNQISAH